QGIVSVGQWGGQGVSSWSDVSADGVVSGITIGYGDIVISLLFHFTSADGQTSDSARHGGTGGEIKKVLFNYPEEYITAITISYGLHEGYARTPLISSLTIKTNTAEYGPFGASGSDTTVTIPIEKGSVVGFFGRAGAFIDALGIHLRPTANRKVVSIGPWGGQEGDFWTFVADFGVIRGINIHYGQVIDSLQFLAKEADDKEETSGKFGGDGGEITKVITINYPEEYITSFSITYGDFYDVTVIKSLTITTNEDTYGPFGDSTSGVALTIPISSGDVVGFFGYADTYINGLGVHLVPK
ncbi:hypothetical protein NMG60_11016272, partial [Bertholletia excelsa]